MQRIGRISAVAAKLPAGKRPVAVATPQALNAVFCKKHQGKRNHSTSKHNRHACAQAQLREEITVIPPGEPRELDFVLQRHDNFAERHVGPRPEDLNNMLQEVGVKVSGHLVF